MEVIVCCNGRVSPGKGRAPGLGSPSLPHLCDSKAAGSLVPICFLFRDLELPFSYFPLFLWGCSLRVFELQPTQAGFLSAAKAFRGVFPCPWPEQHGGSAPAAILLGPFWGPPGWAWWSHLPWQLLTPAGLQLGVQSVPPAPLQGLGSSSAPATCQQTSCCATGCAETPASSRRAGQCSLPPAVSQLSWQGPSCAAACRCPEQHPEKLLRAGGLGEGGNGA